MDFNYVFLPTPRKISSISVEEAILLRRGIRRFRREPIDVDHLSMILWAAYGVTDPRRGFRALPSAGATYPLDTHLLSILRLAHHP